MNQVYGECYTVKSLRDDYELGNTFESVEDARQEIDSLNERAVGQGYPAHRFIICNRKIIKVREDNGQFVMSTVCTTAVEVYPQEVEE